MSQYIRPDQTEAIMRKYKGSFEHLATPASAARRRYRMHNDDSDVLFDPFLRDEARISDSKAFRRLGDKTQVTAFNINSHIRDRRAHVSETTGCGVWISALLGLNVNLTRTIGLGHDIGHVPFGHQAEQYLREHGYPDFCHEIMGVIIAQKLERLEKGGSHGLNLCHQVLNGMMCHSGDFSDKVETPEGWVFSKADKFAYLIADLNDCVDRLGFPPNLLPELVGLFERLGRNQRERQGVLIAALMQESAEKGKLEFKDSPEAELLFGKIRPLMYQMYHAVTDQNPARVLDPIFECFERLKMADRGIDPLLLFCLMTDEDMLYLHNQTMLNIGHIRQTSAGELLDHLVGLRIDYRNPDLEW